MRTLDSVKKHKAWQEFQDQTNISLRNRYVYFAIGKVANSTIKHCLFEVEYEDQPREALSLFDKRASPLLSPFQLRDEDFLNIINGREFFKFAIVRNPFSRLLSCYLDRIRTRSSPPSRAIRRYIRAQGGEPNPLTFAVFVRAACSQKSPEMNAHWRVQWDDICYPEVDFDFIGHFEHLWEDLGTVNEKIWGTLRPEFADPQANYSPKRTDASAQLREFYTDELSELVRNRYRLDFETFGYGDSIEDLMPRR